MANPYYDLELDWLEQELTKWKAAHSALAYAKEIEINTGAGKRKLTRTDLADIRQVMSDLSDEIARQKEELEAPGVIYPQFYQ